MVAVIVVVREVGRTQPEYSLQFEVPAIPQVGDYISVSRSDVREPFSEDLIVRKVWWRLYHPDGAEAVGMLREIFVECDTSLGPYASEAWRRRVDSAEARGTRIEQFDVARSLGFWGEARKTADDQGQ